MSVATPLIFNTQHEDFQLSPAATDDEGADAALLGSHPSPARLPSDCTPTETPPAIDARMSPHNAPEQAESDALARSHQAKKRSWGEANEGGERLPCTTPEDILMDAAIPGACTPQIPPAPTESLARTQFPAQASGKAPAPGVVSSSAAAQPAEPAPTPAAVPAAPSQCDASQGCSAGSSVAPCGGSSGGGGGWRLGSVLSGLMSTLGSMGRKRPKISPVADSLPIVAPPRVLEVCIYRFCSSEP